ncbi:type II toxin-antitoxin system HicB family antitoxin (plasmid) [Oenococcus alcoholitolerans]|uniref:Antitoxin HicB n=1 Tax=Oenococcus alcoholitolerans TaxID=931074 RepID=A0ABR4XT46_9LACO|nr:antitoxin HicB [Oenococcus alcoholitolerans]
MRKDQLIYPVIISEYFDDGHYYVVTSPNLEGLVTQGDSLQEAVLNAQDAIATLLQGEEYPTVQDPKNWTLEDTDRVAWITVDMSDWLKKNTRTVKRSITIPKYLDDLARKNSTNVSRVATEALVKKLS